MEQNCGTMTGAGASSQAEEHQDGKCGMNNRREPEGAGAKWSYFRLVLVAAARRVFTRAFNRLMFFPCFRRIFRSFSRPRGIIPPIWKFR